MDRSLSKTEAKVILDLEWRGQKAVTLAELRKALGASGSYARYVAHRLVRKGWLERVRPGLFQLIPADRGREPVADTNPLAAGALLIAPYFFSFGTACTHHGLTEQVFAEIYLSCRRHRRPETIRDKRYVFIYVSKQHFFGFEEIRILGQPVQLATVERALVDAIDRPRYAGGIGEVSQIAAKAATTVSWDALVEINDRYGSSAIVQRLGYFLDLHQAVLPANVRSDLIGMVRPGSKIQLGSRRRWGTKGKLVQPWNVVENVSRSILMPQSEKASRRVVFPITNNSG